MRLKALFTLLLVALFLAPSCKEKSTYVTTAMFDLRADGIQLSGDPDCDYYLDYFVRIEYPVAVEGMDEAAAQKLCDGVCRRLLEELFGRCSVTESRLAQNEMRSATDKELEYLKDDFIRTNRPLWRALRDILPDEQDERFETAVQYVPLSWDELLETYSLGVNKGIASFLAYRKSVRGKADAQLRESAINWSIRENREIREADIFKPGYEEKLGELLSAHKNEREEAVDFFAQKLSPNGNFILTPKGYTALYGSGEVAPASAGLVRVSVPWDELEAILDL